MSCLDVCDSEAPEAVLHQNAEAQAPELTEDGNAKSVASAACYLLAHRVIGEQ